MFTARRQAARDSFGDYTPQQLGDYVYNSLVSQELIKLMAQVNSVDLANDLTWDGSIIKTYKEVDAIQFRIKHDVWTFPMSQMRLTPPCMCGGYGGHKLNLENLQGQVPTLFEAIAARKKAMEEVELAINTLQSEFKRVWDAVQNINQLVKLWPAAQQLLEGVTDKSGNNVLNRMQQKVVRTRSTPVEVDITNLNAQLLMARIAE